MPHRKPPRANKTPTKRKSEAEASPATRSHISMAEAEGKREAERSPSAAASASESAARHSFEAFFESSIVPMRSLDASGIILRANQAELEFLGYTRDEYVGRDIAAFHEDPASTAEMIARLARGEQLVKQPVRLRAKDGSIRHVLTSATAQFLDSRLTAIYCVSWDAAAEADAEALARESARRMVVLNAERQSLIDQTPFMIVRCTRDLKYRFASRAYADMVGRDPQDLIGQPLADILGREAMDAIRPSIEQVLRGERAAYESELPFPNLGTRRIRAVYTPEFDEAGKVDGWLASITDVTEQQRAEQIRQQLASIVDSSDDAIISKDLDGMIISWNRGAERIFGFTAAEAIGRPITMVIPAHLQHEEPVILDRIRHGEHIDHYETLRHRKDGSLIHVSLTISPVRNAEGKIVGASKIARDITDRKVAEIAFARHAEEQAALNDFTVRLFRAESLPAIYDAALDAILAALRCDRAAILRPDDWGAMRFVSSRGLSARYRAAAEGYNPWPLDARNPETACIGEVGGTDLPEHVRTAAAVEGIRGIAFVPLMAQGRLVGNFIAYYDAPHAFSREKVHVARNLARQLGFAIERMLVEQARQAAERSLRRLSEKLESEVERRTRERDRIWTVSEDLLGVSTFDGYFISINPAWTKLLGWSEDEIKAMHVSALRHPEDEAHSIAGRSRLASGVSTVRIENRFRHKDGSWRWIHWTMTTEDGFIYVSGRNTTTEREAAAALAKAQQQFAHSQKMEALGQLTGGVAHDFNNLLMIVSGHAQILARRLSEPKDLRALSAIQAAATRGESLTRQLLSFSRNQPLDPAVVSPAETIGAVRDILDGLLKVDVELLMDVLPSIWSIHVDKSELELALVNLVVNARDAMPNGGVLTIAAKNLLLESGDTADGLAGEFVALSVADTGCGIASDHLARVFEPFFTTKSADKGTGLGLSQVYGFARRSGGTAAIGSEPGRGTTVTLYLPRSHTDVGHAQARRDGHITAPAEEAVLVVEDNDDVRAVAVALLEQLGYRAIAVGSAAAALDILASRSTPLNLLFTDVVLPGGTDGLTLAQTVKARYPAMPVVLTTGYAKVFDVKPDFPVVRKPYQIATLGRILREALDQPTSDALPAAAARA
jgi:PAS domain S-box-containing protein